MANPRLQSRFAELIDLWNRMVFPQGVLEINSDSGSQTASAATDQALSAEKFDPQSNPDVAAVLKQLSLSDGETDHESDVNLGDPEDDDDDIYVTNDDNPTTFTATPHSTETPVTTSTAVETFTSPNNDVALPAVPHAPITLDPEQSNPPAPKKATRTRSSARNTTQATTPHETLANTEV